MEQWGAGGANESGPGRIRARLMALVADPRERVNRRY